MEILHERQDRQMIIKLVGELDHHAAKGAMQKIDYLLDAGIPLKLIVDFSGITFMDSSGIAIIMRIFRRVQIYGGQMIVTAVPPQAKRVLLTANIQRMVDMQ